ncbi:type I polyketide synthase, partial [Aduncisulcus paluster]
MSASAAVFGEGSVVQDISFEQLLTLGETTPISATATVKSPGALEFVVETHDDGDAAKRAAAVLGLGVEVDTPVAYDLAALRAEHPHRAEGDDLRESSVLAEVSLPREVRAQQGSYIVHPALLDACFQSVIALPDVQAASKNALPLPKGVRSLHAYQSARSTQYCYTRVTKVIGNEVEADIDLLDENGGIVLAVRGFRFGTGASDDEQ